jgi:hypothetical protein
MKPGKWMLAGLALLLVVSQTHAENRTVLIQIKQDKDKKTSVAIHSDEKKEQQSAVSVDDAVKIIGEMMGWGSKVGIYVTSDRSIPRADVKKLLAAVNDNSRLDLEYFGREVPKVVADHFLKVAQDPMLSAQKPSAAPAHQAADVVLIANWLCGNDPAKAFAKPFGDSKCLTASKDSLLYTDIPGVKTPASMKAVNYEFVQTRMQQIKRGRNASPAVLIVCWSLDEPAEDEIRRDKDEPGGRVYYVEVAVGNLAWHWLKVVVRDEGDKTNAKILWQKVS